MSLFEFREYFESVVPWWMPFAIVAVMLAIAGVYAVCKRDI